MVDIIEDGVPIQGLTTTQVTASSKFAWQLQDPETLAEAPPTQNVYATHIDKSDGQKAWYICIIQENGEVANKDVDIKFTIDGNVQEFTGNTLGHGEVYLIALNDIIDATGGAKILVENSSPLPLFGFTQEEASVGKKLPIETLEVIDFKMELKQTTALGTNQTLKSYFRFSSLENV